MSTEPLCDAHPLPHSPLFSARAPWSEQWALAVGPQQLQRQQPLPDPPAPLPCVLQVLRLRAPCRQHHPGLC